VSDRPVAGWRRYVNTLIAGEVSRLARHYDRVLEWMARPEDTGLLLDRIEAPAKARLDGATLPDLGHEDARRTAILLNGVFNHHFDVQALLAEIRPRLARTARLVVVLYNPYFAWLYRLANRWGIRHGPQPETFVTRTDLANLARLSGFEATRVRPAVYCPWPLLGLGTLANRLLPAVPLVRWLGLVTIAVLRPVVDERPRTPSLSVIVPARNERGNIAAVIERLPALGGDLEVIFVEGHSTDGTWDEIGRVLHEQSGPIRVRALRQTGTGKADAVRLGLEHATGELVAILDADLTMPPEQLGRFYDAYRAGLADFVNGSRLVYPMEGAAMRFLNLLGNVFFAKTLSFLLDTRLGDSLCGTKLFARHDWARFRSWTRGFGDYDPFGDFELLFPAAVLGLGIIDVPIRYRQRTYGTTNIRRFRDGLRLVRMTLRGLGYITLGPGAR
jgi:hypothetical protein